MQTYIDFIARQPLLFSLFGIILALIIAGELRRKARGAKSLTPLQATQLINQQACLIVDVRPAAEYRQGHIIDARNLAHTDIRDKGEQLSKDKNTPVLVYCKNGIQSVAAAGQLKQLGFTRVYNLSGGLANWQAESMPLEQ